MCRINEEFTDFFRTKKYIFTYLWIFTQHKVERLDQVHSIEYDGLSF